MDQDKKNKEFEERDVDEDYLMDIISGEELPSNKIQPQHMLKEGKAKEKSRNNSSKKLGYEETFLINRFPSGRNGRVVYIRPEYHERLLRIVQLNLEDKTTLYSYIDNILEHHFSEFGSDITTYFNEHFKPIL
ncbi:DUF3408 domain-containing protein [Chryseobacterium chendengshani]|uniref:DUF3408 domain-containing protein n=1 Tax=Chryseobacterium sp. LJ668 TaxID=2864040 RepID=UPI001C693B51|nr:DUF3408 domain-containing protein [Chryseobacterium sp. LJ668]MBW8523809.1 DUF3408 domain-containing protein [Chryseobacterium sp. LJ668]QYK16752.1 DUF3408 domain-containing protein [Chryseobacterium sp. LJ668]